LRLVLQRAQGGGERSRSGARAQQDDRIIRTDVVTDTEREEDRDLRVGA
jgi:hypothetical protein